MKLLSFVKNGELHWGFADIEKRLVYPAPQVLGENAPKLLLDYIRNRDKFSNAEINNMSEKNGLFFDEIVFKAPIYNPIRNIFCVGKNYLDHIREVEKVDSKKDSNPGCPAFFTKATNTINGPYNVIPSHKGITSMIDYEAELAVVIGRRGTNITVENAMSHVFGYTIINDVSARDLQKNHEQWFKGKSLDGFCPMGPWIVTADEIPDPHNLAISSKVNGELRQNANTSMMMVNIPELISILSKGLTLEPGDVIATGTPAGVGMGFDPPRYLKSGDVVRIEIEKIGYIENKLE